MPYIKVLRILNAHVHMRTHAHQHKHTLACLQIYMQLRPLEGSLESSTFIYALVLIWVGQHYYISQY